ncbi:DUF324 domain-containing protein [Photobacterium marinum]|uniref:DUF324 domain-containing protein n=1 Tax=Photobacterium marinum TaxID=1056511 RepID=L8J557_9GAMM|nr:RAMP superfamily CRISPR-associated protein [Photobacterium marinum]ELR63891.1 DUF324 domain-containing protein [Photobacterium marinum]
MSIKKERTLNSPYHFVPVSESLISSGTFEHSRGCKFTPHDTLSTDKFSGEIKCELGTLTPSIFACYQGNQTNLIEAARTKLGASVHRDKQILSPLFVEMNNNKHQVILGSSIKGMLRNNVAALLPAPMNRVQERTFAYRPNIMPKATDVEMIKQTFPALFFYNNGKPFVHVYTNWKRGTDYCFKFLGNAKKYKYRGSVDSEGKLTRLFKGGTLHHNAHKTGCYITHRALKQKPIRLDITENVLQQFEATTNHLINDDTGHLNVRHPKVKKEDVADLKRYIKQNRNYREWQDNQLIFVEAELNNNQTPEKISSFGNNFRYYWLHSSSIHKNNQNELRPSIQPNTQKNRPLNALTCLFGDLVERSEPEEDLRLAGRVSVNHAVEAIKRESVYERDIWYALPLCAQPKASAYEFYLEQFYSGNLLFELKDYNSEQLQQLAGRKMYVHQDGFNNLFHENGIAADTPQAKNELLSDNKAPIASKVTPTSTQFQFCLRFRQLSIFELGLIYAALDPNYLLSAIKSFPPSNSTIKELHNRTQYTVYTLANKLGYGRPHGFGSVTIKCRETISENIPTPAECVKHMFSKLLEDVEGSSNANAAKMAFVKQIIRFINIKENVKGQTAHYGSAEGAKATLDFHGDIRKRTIKNYRIKPKYAEKASENNKLANFNKG